MSVMSTQADGTPTQSKYDRLIAAAHDALVFGSKGTVFCPDHRAQIIGLSGSVVLRPRWISARLPTARPQ